MATLTPFLLAKTPRAGRFNHHLLLPQHLAATKSLPETQINALTQQVTAGIAGHYLLAQHTVRQDSTTGREGQEMLILAGVDVARLSAAQRAEIEDKLHRRLAALDELVTRQVDWDVEGRAALVGRAELEAWYQADFAAMNLPAAAKDEGREMNWRFWIMSISAVLLAGVIVGACFLSGCFSNPTQNPNMQLKFSVSEQIAKIALELKNMGFKQVSETRLRALYDEAIGQNVDPDVIQNALVAFTQSCAKHGNGIIPVEHVFALVGTSTSTAKNTLLETLDFSLPCDKTSLDKVVDVRSAVYGLYSALATAQDNFAAETGKLDDLQRYNDALNSLSFNTFQNINFDEWLPQTEALQKAVNAAKRLQQRLELPQWFAEFEAKIAVARDVLCDSNKIMQIRNALWKVRTELNQNLNIPANENQVCQDAYILMWRNRGNTALSRVVPHSEADATVWTQHDWEMLQTLPDDVFDKQPECDVKTELVKAVETLTTVLELHQTKQNSLITDMHKNDEQQFCTQEQQAQHNISDQLQMHLPAEQQVVEMKQAFIKNVQSAEFTKQDKYTGFPIFTPTDAKIIATLRAIFSEQQSGVPSQEVTSLQVVLRLLPYPSESNGNYLPQEIRDEIEKLQAALNALDE